MKFFSLVIVVPCFNEYKRLDKEKFISFLEKEKDVLMVFVNDGSTDRTLQKLNSLKELFPQNIIINNLELNLGKANAIHKAFLYSFNNINFNKIAYLDADLSTSLYECKTISEKLNQEISFVFGSRILKIDTIIKRKFYRFLIGRVLATIISINLGVNVYDTQCGCKVFTKDLAKLIFKEKFLSKWLFDVEIFFRLIGIFGKENLIKNVREIPLNSWIDDDDSKVKFTYFFKLWYDLFTISKHYKMVLKNE